MKNTLLSLLALAALTACSSTSSRRAGIDLFNGKDLAGWQPVLADASVKPEAVWSVEDGILICKGEPMGYLHSVQSYQNFRWSVEYRWAPGKPPGNSGLFSRINGPARALPRCIETQLKHGDAGDLYAFHGMALRGEAPRYKQIPKHELGGDINAVKRVSGNEKPAGEWNQVEIEVNGGKVTVWFNGQKVNEASDAEQIAGPVGLQSEGGEVHFRSVRLTPLP